MSDIVPLKASKKLKGGSNIFNKLNLNLNQNLLLPILFIFMNNKNGAGGFNIFNNFSNSNLKGIFSKLNLSSANLEKSLKILSSINPQSASNNTLISSLTLLLETVYKITTFQELANKFNSLNINVGDKTRIDKNEQIDEKEINFKVLDAISELLDDESKSTIKSGMELFKVMTLLQNVNGFTGKVSNTRSGLDISSILKFISPLISQQNDLNDLGDMKKIIDLFSNNYNNKEIKKSKKSNRKNNKTFNKDEAIDILEYDEEDSNVIDELLNDLFKEEKKPS